jgi:hypothetical protein
MEVSFMTLAIYVLGLFLVGFAARIIWQSMKGGK